MKPIPRIVIFDYLSRSDKGNMSGIEVKPITVGLNTRAFEIKMPIASGSSAWNDFTIELRGNYGIVSFKMSELGIAGLTTDIVNGVIMSTVPISTETAGWNLTIPARTTATLRQMPSG